MISMSAYKPMFFDSLLSGFSTLLVTTCLLRALLNRGTERNIPE